MLLYDIVFFSDNLQSDSHDKAKTQFDIYIYTHYTDTDTHVSFVASLHFTLLEL